MTSAPDPVHALCCKLLKAGEPEVEAVIETVSVLLEAWWRARAREIIRLSEQDRKRAGFNQDFLVSILASLRLDFRAPPPRELMSQIELGGRQLVNDGALRGGALAAAEAAQLGITAGTDLILLLETRAESALAALEPAVAELVEAQRAAIALASRDVPAAAEAASDAEARWREALESALDADAGRMHPLVESWGYRWFNVGTFAAARQAGFSTLEIRNNPPFGPDSRTTPFCIYAHGKRIPLARAEASVATYNAAVRRANPLALPETWRLLTREEATRGDFPALLEQLGLPPYHFGCRDIVVPVR